MGPRLVANCSMPLRVLIIPDKFKGTLTAQAAAAAIAAGWRAARPDDTLECLPMSDGGDGFGEIVSGLIDAVPQTVDTVDAAARPCQADWWWQAERRLAVIESANVIGLARLPPGRYHPFDLDTRGLGQVVQAAIAAGAKRCLIGIGGSATNDGGFGVAHALGWRFLDARGKAISRWIDLVGLAGLEPPDVGQPPPDVTVAVDVQNPLLGPTGATRVYGPQKGLKEVDFELAESCLSRLAEVVKRELGLDCASIPGAGAAGGLGFGLRCFLEARLEPGFELFAHHANLAARLRTADLVITAEGAIDRSTLMGKGVGRVAERCVASGVPCIGLAGRVSLPSAENLKNKFFDLTRGLVPDLTHLDEAMTHAALWLERLTREAAKEWTASPRWPVASKPR